MSSAKSNNVEGDQYTDGVADTGTGARVRKQSPTISTPVIDNVIPGYSTTATAAGTTTLTASSNFQQYFTGSTTQTVLLPVASTLTLGQQFRIVNNSSGVVTVQSSGGNTIQAMAASTILIVTCILTSGTGTASWSAYYGAQNGGALTATSLTFNPTTGGIVGTTTNDNAAAGKVGEYISSSILAASAVSLSTGTAANVTSISLTAGDWDVTGSIYFNPNVATTSTYLSGSISTTSATDPTVAAENSLQFSNKSNAAGTVVSFDIGQMRISVASTTTVYFVATATFAVNTMTVYGFIGARRVR